MKEIENLLVCVQRTNPDMTKDKLIEELQKTRYSALCLALVCGNNKTERVSA